MLPDSAADQSLFHSKLTSFRRKGLDAPAAARAASYSLRFDHRFTGAWFPETPDAVIPQQSHEWFQNARTDEFETKAHQIHAELDAQFHAIAEAQFVEDCVNETGLVEPEDEKTAKRRRDRAELAFMSYTIARRLRAGGYESMRFSTERLWKATVHTNVWEEIPQYRRVCFIPSVAAVVRSQITAALEYFMQSHRYCRFWTFSPGKRCTVGEVNARLTYLHGKLSDLNRELQKRFGWEIILRCSELGTPELTQGEAKRRRAARLAAKQGVSVSGVSTTTNTPVSNTPVSITENTPFSLDYSPASAPSIFDASEDDVEGRIIFEGREPTYHPHAHVVVYPKSGRLSNAKFEEMKAFVRDFMGGYFNEGSVIRKAREVCKYVTKPCDLLRLTPLQLCDLARALHKVHMVQPMGALRTLIRDIRNPECPQKLCRHTDPDTGKLAWRLRFDHNKKRLKFADGEEDAGPDMPGAPIDGAPVAPPVNAHFKTCAVIAKLRPAYGPAGVKEPRVLVRGNWQDKSVVNRSELGYKLWSDTVEQFEYGIQLRAIQFGRKPWVEPAWNPFLEDPPEPPPLMSTLRTITGEQETFDLCEEPVKPPTLYDPRHAVPIL